MINYLSSMKSLILIILLLMIFYDFSLHLLRLILGLDAARKFKYYWPGFLIGKEKAYNLFWSIYWGFAFLLLFAYLLFF
jgi:hypothetical protein